jgi:heme exporter protein D
MDLGPHAAFIWTAYGATALVVTALIARAVLEERRQKRALIRLEAQGVRRRSARTTDDRMR